MGVDRVHTNSNYAFTDYNYTHIILITIVVSCYQKHSATKTCTALFQVRNMVTNYTELLDPGQLKLTETHALQKQFSPGTRVNYYGRTGWTQGVVENDKATGVALVRYLYILIMSGTDLVHKQYWSWYINSIHVLESILMRVCST